MSRTSFGKPEFRLAFDYPHITVTRSDAQEPVRVFEIGAPDLVAELRRLAAEIDGARGRLTVVLPEGEVGGHDGPGTAADEQVRLADVDALLAQTEHEADLPGEAGMSSAAEHEGAPCAPGPAHTTMLSGRSPAP